MLDFFNHSFGKRNKMVENESIFLDLKFKIQTIGTFRIEKPTSEGRQLTPCRSPALI